MGNYLDHKDKIGPVIKTLGNYLPTKYIAKEFVTEEMR